MEFRILFSIEIISPGLRLFLAQPRKKNTLWCIIARPLLLNCVCVDPHTIDRFYIWALHKKKRHTPTKKRKQGSPQRVFVDRQANISFCNHKNIWLAWSPSTVSLRGKRRIFDYIGHCKWLYAKWNKRTARYASLGCVLQPASFYWMPRSNFAVLYV